MLCLTNRSENGQWPAVILYSVFVNIDKISYRFVIRRDFRHLSIVGRVVDTVTIYFILRTRLVLIKDPLQICFVTPADKIYQLLTSKKSVHIYEISLGG